jgi:hypothetical protein
MIDVNFGREACVFREGIPKTGSSTSEVSTDFALRYKTE